MNCFKVIPVGLLIIASSLFCRASLASSILTGQEFLDVAAVRSISEGETAKIALNKSSDTHIKAYAQAMIVEQQAALDSLRRFAKEQHLQMYSDAELQAKARVYIFQRNGKAFDPAYVEMRSLERKKAVSLFRMAAESADVALKQYATAQLPVLMRELYMAQTMVEQSNNHELLATK